MANTPSNGIPYVPENTIDPAAGLNLALNVVDALLQSRVENMVTNAPPGSPADGVQYIVGSAPTGAWVGHSRALARWVAEGAFWQFYAGGVQAWLVINKADNTIYSWNSTTHDWVAAAGLNDAPSDDGYYVRRNAAWVASPVGIQSIVAGTNVTIDDTDPANPIVSASGGSGGVPEAPNDGKLYGRESEAWVEAKSDAIAYDNTTSGLAATNVKAAIDEVAASTTTPIQTLVTAASDEVTALTAGTAKVTFRNPFASPFIITHIKASLTVAQTSGSILTVDVNESGVSLLSTKITIDNTEKTSETAAIPPVVSDASIGADAEITIDIDQVGDGTAKGLKIYIIGHL